MQNPKKKRLRWDRIGMVAGVFALATLGIAAVVPGEAVGVEGESEGHVAVMSSGAPEAEMEVQEPRQAEVEPVREPQPQEEAAMPAQFGDKQRSLPRLLARSPARALHLAVAPSTP